MGGKRVSKISNKLQREIDKQFWALAGQIQEARKAQGLSQERLAEELEISVTTVKSIEQGWRYPSLPMLFQICKFLKIHVIIG